MVNFYMTAEPKFFCLLIIGFLYVFRAVNINEQLRENKLLYYFTFGAVFFSVLSDILRTEIMQTVCFAICGIESLFALYFGLKYAFCIEENGKKALLVILSVLFGVLSFYSVKAGTNVTEFVLTFIIIVLFALEQYNVIRQDNLTKLYNRYGMDAELKEQLKQYKRDRDDSFYIIACDLDKFKHINDTWGHPEGDRALVLVAEALTKAAKKFDSEVFRIGGDEFVIITDKSQQGLAEKVVKAVQDEIDSIEFRDDFDIRISIGYALYDGVTSIDDLLNNADKKLYEAKKTKRC